MKNMENYIDYQSKLKDYNEAKAWLKNMDKVDSQSGSLYRLHDVTVSATYCGQSYAGANNYHESPKKFNKYLSRAVRSKFTELCNHAVELMRKDCLDKLVSCEDELKNLLLSVSEASKENRINI